MSPAIGGTPVASGPKEQEGAREGYPDGHGLLDPCGKGSGRRFLG